MAEVTLTVRSEVAQAISGIVKLVESTKQVEAGMKNIASSGNAAERQIVQSFGRMDSVMRRSIQEFNNRQKMTAGREDRFIAPARFRGLDTTDLASVQFGRFLKAGDLRNLRTDRSLRASNAGYATLNAEREQAAMAKAAELEEYAGNYWSQKQQAADVESQIALNNFEKKINMRNQAKANRSKMISKVVSGATAAAASLYAVGMYWDQVEMKLDAVAQGGIAFNDEMRPLLGLGGNLKDIAGNRAKVRATSIANGMDTAQTAAALFMLQSTADNLGPDMQKQIFSAGSSLTQVAGGGLETNLVAITKLMENYGKAMGTADNATAKLAVTNDMAAVSMEDLATMLPDVLPAAKLMGISFEDIAGSIITASATMGKNEKTFTGIRNFFLHLPDAMKAGLVHKGPFLQMLKELQAASPETMIDTFGERTVAVVAALAEKSDQVASNSRTIGRVGPGVLADRAQLRLQDPVISDAEVLKAAEQQRKQMDAIRFENPELRKRIMDMKLAETGYDMTVDPLANSFDVTGLGKKIAIARDMAAGDNSSNKAIAIAGQIAALRKAGDAVSLMRAGRMEIQYAKLLNNGSDAAGSVGAAKGLLGGFGQTGESDLGEFDSLNAKGYRISSQQFMAYRGLMTRGKKLQATMMLARLAESGDAQAESIKALNTASFYTTKTGDQDFIGQYQGATEAYQAAKAFAPGLSFEKFLAYREQGQVDPKQQWASTKSMLGAGWANVKTMRPSMANIGQAALGLLTPGGIGLASMAPGFIQSAFSGASGGEPVNDDPLSKLSNAAGALTDAAAALQAAGDRLGKPNDDGEESDHPTFNQRAAAGNFVKNASAAIHK